MSADQTAYRCTPNAACIDVVAPLRHADINERHGINGTPLREKAQRVAQAHLEGLQLRKGGAT